ncbi:clostripain-related cysteine peptidase [Candidatus Dependentiae bacterium]
MFKSIQRISIKRVVLITITQLIFNINANQLEIKPLDLKPTTSTPKKCIKDWNFMVYITSNNNLYNDSINNIIQMMKVGSNKNLNILIQQDTYGKNEIARYYIEKERANLMQLEKDSPASISGTPQNLYDFAEWAVTNYPAKKHALILWNHGSGIEDPSIWGKKDSQYSNQIFSINSQTGLLELNRKSKKDRGIAFNEVFETYITNQELRKTLHKIKSDLLRGNKIDILGMDACHMAMFEIGTQIKKDAKYMVGSEEVEPGSGWNYTTVLKPFTNKTLTPKEFAINIVKAYGKQYSTSYADHTQSAVDLEKFSELESCLNKISSFLINLLNQSNNTKIIELLKKIRTSDKLTTIFDNKNYVDHKHFYQSLLSESKKLDSKIYTEFKIDSLQNLLLKGIETINQTIIANTSGPNLPKASGLSFYYPKKKIHSSYPKTIFAQKTKWIEFLKKYIKLTRNNKNIDKLEKPEKIS